MIGVLSGFFVVWAIILVGMFVGRRGLLGENARSVLSSLTFFVASPALLFETLSKARLHDVFAAPLLVTAVGAIITGLLFFLIVKFWLKRSLPESLMSSMSSSLANSANLGIPIAVFVLGDASYVAPLLIFQLAFFTPMYLMALDASTSTHRTTPLRFLLMIVIAAGATRVHGAGLLGLPGLEQADLVNFGTVGMHWMRVRIHLVRT